MGCHTYFNIPIKQSLTNYKKAGIWRGERKVNLTIVENHPDSRTYTLHNDGGVIVDTYRYLLVKQLPTGITEGTIPFIRCKPHYGKIIYTLEQFKKYSKRHTMTECEKYMHLFEWAWKRYPKGFVYLG